jgi:hypothetical protein
MPDSVPLKLPIPTSFGWLLLDSLIGRSPIELAAEIAAVGAGRSGEDEAKAQEAYRKNLHLWEKGRQPRPGSLAEFNARMKLGMRYLQSKSVPGEPGASETFFQRLDAAVGPFAALAASFIPDSPDAAQQDLLDFSSNIDQLGVTLEAATRAEALERARDTFLGANWLDERYWGFPEPGMDEPGRTREAIRTCRNWDELTRATVPLVLNITLSWLSRLDLAVLRGGRHQATSFPLFLPLAARFTPAAAAALRAGRPLPPGKWHAITELPVSNLIVMLQAIVSDINGRLRNRANPPRSRVASKEDRTKRSVDLSEFRRHDMLSVEQFNSLLAALEPDATPQGDEGCGFDISALHLAANLFSLLTPRDGTRPTNESRRKKPTSITICQEIPDAYLQWWRLNLKELAKHAIEHPWPDWLTSSMKAARHPDHLR